MSRGGHPALDGLGGRPYDNALSESFFATLECELLDRERFPTPAAARIAVFDFIENAPLTIGLPDRARLPRDATPHRKPVLARPGPGHW